MLVWLRRLLEVASTVCAKRADGKAGGLPLKGKILELWMMSFR